MLILKQLSKSPIIYIMWIWSNICDSTFKTHPLEVSAVRYTYQRIFSRLKHKFSGSHFSFKPNHVGLNYKAKVMTGPIDTQFRNLVGSRFQVKPTYLL